MNNTIMFVQGKVKLTYKAEESSRRTTKLAYPDMVAKPPRDVAKRQVLLDYQIWSLNRLDISLNDRYY